MHGSPGVRAGWLSVELRGQRKNPSLENGFICSRARGFIMDESVSQLVILLSRGSRGDRVCIHVKGKSRVRRRACSPVQGEVLP